MNDYYSEDIPLDSDDYDFAFDLTEEDMFNIFGRKDLGIPMNLMETDVFNLFKFIGIGIPFELTKDEMTDVVLCLKRVKPNKRSKRNKIDLLSEDEDGRILIS